MAKKRETVTWVDYITLKDKELTEKIKRSKKIKEKKWEAHKIM